MQQGPRHACLPPYGCHQRRKESERRRERARERERPQGKIQFNLLFSRRKTRTNIWMWNLAPSTEMMFRFRYPFDPCSVFFFFSPLVFFFFLSRLVRNPKSAAYSGDFSDTVFTRQEEVGALPLPATYRALSIISPGIHGNRSTAGEGWGFSMNRKTIKRHGVKWVLPSQSKWWWWVQMLVGSRGRWRTRAVEERRWGKPERS